MRRNARQKMRKLEFWRSKGILRVKRMFAVNQIWTPLQVLTSRKVMCICAMYEWLLDHDGQLTDLRMGFLAVCSCHTHLAFRNARLVEPHSWFPNSGPQVARPSQTQSTTGCKGVSFGYYGPLFVVNALISTLPVTHIEWYRALNDALRWQLWLETKSLPVEDRNTPWCKK